MRRPWVKWTLVGFGAALALAFAGFVWWGLTPLGPTPVALSALKSDDAVRVVKTDAGYEFSPASGKPVTGLVFYPGGHVDVRSYAPLCRKVAANGHLVVLVPMPLSLAVFAPESALRAFDGHKEIAVWAVGGHSLGGAMAASFAAKHPDDIGALALYAAYAAGSADLKHTSVNVLDIYGSRDGVLDRENHEAGKAKMPPSYTEIVIHGGNHAQFGDYGPQPGDNDALISASRQQQSASDATEQLLQTIAP